MIENYGTWLHEKLIKAEQDIGLDANAYDFQIYNDQDFEKASGKYKLKSNSIVVVLKWFPASLSFNVTSTPLNILFFTEENGNEVVRGVLQAFANSNNYLDEKSGTTLTTHQYNQPAVLSNFNYVGTGYRSAYYISGTIEVATNIIDLDYFKYTSAGGVVTDYTKYLISFAPAYNATFNSEMIGTDELIVSKEQTATCSFSIALPCSNLQDDDNDLLVKCIKQMFGTISGNSDYSFSYSIHGIVFTSTYKLKNIVYTKNAGAVPSIALLFIR